MIVAEDAAAHSVGPREWLLVAAVLVAVGVAYGPAWNGGLLWDDAAHLTRPELRSWRGLWRIWFEPGATQQHYPLVHSAFWVQHRLWGDNPSGYHLVNLGLHSGAAAMVSRFERARRRGIEKAAPKEKAQREEVPLPCDRAVRSAQVEGSSPGASSFPLAAARRAIVHDATQDPRRAERRSGVKAYCVRHPTCFSEGESSVHRLAMYACSLASKVPPRSISAASALSRK